jgi:hypothetical protein
VNRDDVNSEIEGKAAKGSGERVGKGTSFRSVVRIIILRTVTKNVLTPKGAFHYKRRSTAKSQMLQMLPYEKTNKPHH